VGWSVHAIGAAREETHVIGHGGATHACMHAATGSALLALGVAVGRDIHGEVHTHYAVLPGVSLGDAR